MDLTTWTVIYYNDKHEKIETIIETFKNQIDFAIAEINEELEKVEEYWDIISIKRND